MEMYDEPLTIFRDALPNLLTRDRYERRLEWFFKFSDLQGDGLETIAQTFVVKAKENPNWAVSCIMKYLRYQKERVQKGELSASTLPNYYKPIKLFCEMNDIVLNWRKITRGIPKGRRHSTDRIPTLDEIKQLLKYPDRRIKPAILTMLSSGIRLGAWDFLRWGDITPINKNEKVVAAKIIVYRGEPDEYGTFMTPEAYDAIKEYLDFRASHGELITEKTWVLRDEFDLEKSSRGLATVPKQLKSTGLKRLIERALWAQKLRKPLENGNKRHEFKADHGFRKYFKTVAERHMKSLHVEMLMGHSTGLADNYYRISEQELVEEYLKAVPALTVYITGNIMDNEQIKSIEKELKMVKSDFVGLLQLLTKNTSFKQEDIDKFLEIRHHLRHKIEDDLGMKVSENEILF